MDETSRDETFARLKSRSAKLLAAELCSAKFLVIVRLISDVDNTELTNIGNLCSVVSEIIALGTHYHRAGSVCETISL